MKHYILFFCLITGTIQGMHSDLGYPQKNKDPFFKELRMSFQEDPNARKIIKTCGGILLVVGIFRPWLALGTATAAGLSTLLAYCQDREQAIRERKMAKDEIAFCTFAHGSAASIEKVCQADEYLQTDTESLAQQNTIYLIKLLKKYNPSNPHLKNHQLALNTLKTYHADILHAQTYFQSENDYPHALAWLNNNQK